MYGLRLLRERARDEETEERALIKIWALKDRKSKAVGSHSVPVKGSGDGYAAKRVAKMIDEWGRTSVVLRSHGENSISELKKRVKASREEQTMVETAPRGDHQANGEAEQCVGEVAGPARVLKAALERKIGCRISADRAVLSWAVDYVGVMITRFRVGGGGVTPLRG